EAGASGVGAGGARFAATAIEGLRGRVRARGQDAALEITRRLEAPITKFLGGRAQRFFDWLDSPKGAAALEQIGRAVENVVGIIEAFADAAGVTFLFSLLSFEDSFGQFL